MSMSLQYITDSNGLTTGVFIPINEWNILKSKLTEEDKKSIPVPEWQQEIVSKRVESYKTKPEIAVDFDSALEDIEKEL